ncbi:hypothetical protein PJL18_02886 [Paenarthrobacter nicotinovorans]|nr:hypothetical protein [Paenarthrobacter nicotinovorans]
MFMATIPGVMDGAGSGITGSGSTMREDNGG